MKTLKASKGAAVEIKEMVAKHSGDVYGNHGALVRFGGHEYTVKRITFADPDTISFSHVPIGVDSKNTLVLSNGQEFSICFTSGHNTCFYGL